jgi:hypothetical protein
MYFKKLSFSISAYLSNFYLTPSNFFIKSALLLRNFSGYFTADKSTFNGISGSLFTTKSDLITEVYPNNLEDGLGVLFIFFSSISWS